MDRERRRTLGELRCWNLRRIINLQRLSKMPFEIPAGPALINELVEMSLAFEDEAKKSEPDVDILSEIFQVINDKIDELEKVVEVEDLEAPDLVN